MRPSIRQDVPKAAVAACLIALGVAGPVGVRTGLAQGVPRSYEASPEVSRYSPRAARRAC